MKLDNRSRLEREKNEQKEDEQSAADIFNDDNSDFDIVFLF